MFDKILGSVIAPIGGIIDDLHFSGEEKAELKTKINGQVLSILPKILAYERDLIKEKASIIRAELADGNLISKSWRPLVMLIFTGLLVMTYMGWADSSITEKQQIELLGIIKFGLGGYIVGRSAEKVVGKGLNMLAQFKNK